MVEEREVYADDVRAWFEAVPAPAPRLDVENTVATGRVRARRRRRYRIGTGAAALCLSVGVALPAAASVWQRTADPETGPDSAAAASSAPASPAPGPTSSATPTTCVPTVLTPPAGLAARGVKDPESVVVTAVDPSGRYVVGDTYGGFNASPAAVLWDLKEGREGRLLPTLGDHTTPTAVNANGVVIGLGAKGNGAFFGWIYRDGKVKPLPLPPGYDELFEPVGINAAGDVVGNVNDARHTKSALVVWPAANPDRPQILKAPPGEQPVAAGIRDDGTVVAWLPGQRGVYQWPGGKAANPVRLPLPSGATGARADLVRGQWALGLAFPAGSSGVPAEGIPVRWDLDAGTVEVIPVAPVSSSGAAKSAKASVTSVNAGGDVTFRGPPATVRRGGRSQELPLPEGTTGEVAPAGLSDDGAVVAGSVHLNPEANIVSSRPVVWRC